jgi:hypothetical protein
MNVSPQNATAGPEPQRSLFARLSEFNPANHPTQTANANNKAPVMIVTP